MAFAIFDDAGPRSEHRLYPSLSTLIDGLTQTNMPINTKLQILSILATASTALAVSGACACSVNFCETTRSVSGCQNDQNLYNYFCDGGNGDIYSSYSNYVYNGKPDYSCSGPNDNPGYWACNCQARTASQSELTVDQYNVDSDGFVSDPTYYDNFLTSSSCKCDIDLGADWNGLRYFSYGNDSDPVTCRGDTGWGVISVGEDDQIGCGTPSGASFKPFVCNRINPALANYQMNCKCTKTANQAVVSDIVPYLTPQTDIINSTRVDAVMGQSSSSSSQDSPESGNGGTTSSNDGNKDTASSSNDARQNVADLSIILGLTILAARFST
jgi:hypothetical protein